MSENPVPSSLENFMPGREGARQLVHALRLVDTIPNFKWHYPTICTLTEGCGTIGCAVGLAMQLWPDHFVDREATEQQQKDEDKFGLQRTLVPLIDENLAALLGMTPEFVADVFYGEGNLWDEDDISIAHITPQMVADKIEQWLLNHPPSN